MSRASTAIRIMVVVLVLLAAASGLLAPHFARTFGWITGDAEDAAAEKTTLPPIEPLEGPWIVAVQPGHMRIGELPEELSHRRGDTGAVYGSVREAAINRAVVDALIPLMESEGWKTVLVPATVPPGLRADVFLSIHADGSNNPAQRGWKISPPWRPSPASRGLAAELAGAFSEETGLVEHENGITIYMRGYFGFNYRRYTHAISPYTPAALIELGFVTNAEDRILLTGRPEYWAGIILRGLKRYFQGRERRAVEDLHPLRLPWIAVGAEGAVLRRRPDTPSEPLMSVDAGELLIPVDESEGWYEVFVRRRRTTGWVKKSDVEVIEDIFHRRDG